MVTVWRRLSDRTKLPRCLWYPAAPVGVDDPEFWQKQFDDISTTIRRSMFGIIGYAAFCLIALGQPDAQILRSAAVRLPVVNTSVSVEGFMLIGPLVLVGLTAYLHIFVGRWVIMKRNKTKDSLIPPYIFNLPSRSAAGVTTFIFYWLPPIVLASFVFKALPFTNVQFPILWFAALTTTVLVFLAIRRCPDNRRKRRNRLLWPLLLFLLANFVYVSMWPINPSLVRIPFYRTYNLSYADLSGVYLRRAELYDAELFEAYLIGTDLMGANLSEANLGGANLSEANLQDANLSGADLQDANLSGANLQDANLSEADLRGADLRGADLRGADLRGAYLSSADLSEADLRNAYLKDADLVFADLRRADLRDAFWLTCKQLITGRHWEYAFRDFRFDCGLPIPDPPAEPNSNK